MRHPLLTTLLALLPLTASAEDLGPIHFTPPDGWQSTTSKPGGAETRLYVAPGSDQQHQAAILIVLSPKSDARLDLRANFDQAVKGALGGRKILKASDVTSSKSRDGYDVVSQLVAAANDDSQANLLIVRCTAANVDDRLAAFCYVANDGPTFEKHQAAFNTLLANIRLGEAKPRTSPLDAISSAPPREAPKTDTSPAAPEAKSSLPDPAAVLKYEDSRRKPGYVTGNIYDSTGHPFALKGASVEVHCFGTTFAGAKTSYNIPVDSSGHYEQRVPNGLYRLLCQAQIPFNGETLPITLDCADGQPSDKDQNSADAGICKDFVLKLSGERAGGAQRHGHNGWDFCAVDGADPLHWFSSRGASTPQITLTLTPTSPMIDGSKGRPIEYRCDPRTLSTVNRFPGTPIASYRVTATLTYPDGTTKPALLTTDPSGRNQSDHADITFRPNPDRSALGTLITPYVYVTDVQR
jgi:hypothetical protein